MSKRHTMGEALPEGQTVWMLGERRRPDRLPEVSPELLPLIREDMLPTDPLPQLPIAWPEEGIDEDELGAIRAVMLAAALSLPLWAVVGAGIEYLME